MYVDWTAIISVLAVVALFAFAFIWKRSKGKRGEKQVAAQIIPNANTH